MDLLSSGICLTDIYHLAWCMLRVKFNGIVAIADIFFTTHLLPFSHRPSEKDIEVPVGGFNKNFNAVNYSAIYDVYSRTLSKIS